MNRTVMKICITLVLVFLNFTTFAEQVLVDARGKKLFFPQPPKRVVTIVRSAPIIYFAVDGTAKHIVGMNYDSKVRYFTSGIYAQLMPALKTVQATAAREGFAPNVESILQMNPDAIIQWIYDPKIIEPLERVGMTVVGWDCCTKDHRLSYLRMTGVMSGNTKRADALIKLQKDSDDSLRILWKNKSKKKFKTILIIDQIDDQVRVVANPSLDLLLAGANNLAADDSGQWWRTIDIEQLYVWNPDAIFIPSYVVADNLSPQSFYQDKLFRELNAVKKKRVYKFPLITKTPDSPEIYLAEPWIARVLYGKKIVPNFRKQLLKAYKEAYQRTLSEKQVTTILAIEQNSFSDGYLDLFRDLFRE